MSDMEACYQAEVMAAFGRGKQSELEELVNACTCV